MGCNGLASIKVQPYTAAHSCSCTHAVYKVTICESTCHNYNLQGQTACYEHLWHVDGLRWTNMLSPGVCQTSTCFRQHLFLIFVHINGVWSGWLSFRIGINLTGAQTARVICWVIVVIFGCCCISAATHSTFTFCSDSWCYVVFSIHRLDRSLQELLIALQALRWRSSNNRSNGSPLRRHELG